MGRGLEIACVSVNAGGGVSGCVSVHAGGGVSG